MHSHAGLVFSVESIRDYLNLQADDRILSVLPIAFTYGLSQLLLSVRVGATLLLERSFTFPAKTLARLRGFFAIASAASSSASADALLAGVSQAHTRKPVSISPFGLHSRENQPLGAEHVVGAGVEAATSAAFP